MPVGTSYNFKEDISKVENNPFGFYMKKLLVLVILRILFYKLN